MHLPPRYAQLLFAEGLVICPRFDTASHPPQEALESPKCLSPHSLTPAGPQQWGWVQILPTLRFGWCLGTDCGCLSPLLKGTRTAVRSCAGSYLGQSLAGGGMFNANFLWLLFLNTRGFCLKILLFRSTVAHTGSLSMAKGCQRCRSARSEEARLRTPGALEESQSAAQTSLGSHSLCVTTCNVCADCANSVELYAHQITPLKRLGVGKESPAKHWCLEARCLLTCNASRGPAGCGGPCFIFYKSCCLLQHVPDTQVAVTSCSPVLLETAPRSSPVGHQPKI